MACQSGEDMFCDVPMIHEEVVRRVFELLPGEDTTTGLAEIFKVFGDPTRVRILQALRHSELCVCDLSALLSMSQSAVSHQLRILRGARLVRNRREGRVIYYSLMDDHVKTILDVGNEHLSEASDLRGKIDD
jgi:DNA-binding transcriptional ArsR family regulator